MTKKEWYKMMIEKQQEAEFRYGGDHNVECVSLEWRTSSYMLHYKGERKPVNIKYDAKMYFQRLTKKVRTAIETTMPRNIVVSCYLDDIYAQGYSYNYGGYVYRYWIKEDYMRQWLEEAQKLLGEETGTLVEKRERRRKEKQEQRQPVQESNTDNRTEAEIIEDIIKERNEKRARNQSSKSLTVNLGDLIRKSGFVFDSDSSDGDALITTTPR